MKILLTSFILTIVLGMLMQSSEPVPQTINVVNTVCDDPHVRYMCVDCDSMEFQHLIDVAPDSVGL